MDAERVKENRKLQEAKWGDVEKLIPKYAGKMPATEVLAKINEASEVTRSLGSLYSKAASLGWSLRFKG